MLRTRAQKNMRRWKKEDRGSKSRNRLSRKHPKDPIVKLGAAAAAAFFLYILLSDVDTMSWNGPNALKKDLFQVRTSQKRSKD